MDDIPLSALAEGVPFAPPERYSFPGAEETRMKDDSATVTKWMSELDSAKRREKTYRKGGRRILDIYNGEQDQTIAFNILFSNTETLLPALYSATPRPIVSRRYKDEDPLGKATSLAAERMLTYLLDTNVDGYETFDESVRSATLDALLPGRGVTGVKYDAEIDADTSYVGSELVCTDTKKWDRVLFAYAQKWSKVGWVAYEEFIDKTEAERLFGAEITAKITFTRDADLDRSQDDPDSDERDRGEKKTACIYQIWDKDGGRKVRYVSPQYPHGYLKVEDDPLGLTGFFNCPKPLRFIEKSNDLEVTALYSVYENQACELNKITLRINRIVDAIKARGVYDAELGDDLATLMAADDNALVPADKSSSLAAEKGLGNAIWFMPIEQLVSVLMQLYEARERCKQVIYEITGISDILRGASKASETATAQNIKAQWGSLRLKRLQREVQRYARDLMRIMVEVAALKFSEDTWAKTTGLPYLTEIQSQQLMQVMQAAQMSGQPPDPQMQQAIKQPTWGQVLGLLKDDLQRSYKIDMETNSTVEPEAVEDQKNMSDMMMAVGQFLNGVGPLVAQGVMPFQVAQSLLLAITKQFRFGSEIEDLIKDMQPPPPPKEEGDGGMQMQMEHAKMQMEQARMQMEGQIAQATEQRLQQADAAKHQREMQAEQARLQLEREKMQMMLQIELAKLEATKQATLSTLQAERHTEQMKAQMQQETELRKAEIQRETQLAMSQMKVSAVGAEA